MDFDEVFDCFETVNKKIEFIQRDREKDIITNRLKKKINTLLGHYVRVESADWSETMSFLLVA